MSNLSPREELILLMDILEQYDEVTVIDESLIETSFNQEIIINNNNTNTNNNNYIIHTFSTFIYTCKNYIKSILFFL